MRYNKEPCFFVGLDMRYNKELHGGALEVGLQYPVDDDVSVGAGQ